MHCDIIMVGVVVCGSISSVKALWETRIKKRKEEQDEEEEQRRRRAAGGGATGRSGSTHSPELIFVFTC